MRYQVYRAPKVTIHQRIVLEAESAVVRFETVVDWHEKHRMLRAEFFPSHYGAEALCEIQFGHIARPTTERDSVEKAQFEICAHKWIAVQDETGGFALLNDGKYGHRAKNGVVSLNLLRSPTFPDKTADRGSHEFTYAFMPFEQGDLPSVIAEGYRLNNPLLIGAAATVRQHGRGRRRSPSSSRRSSPPKTATASSCVCTRASARATTTALRTTLPHTHARSRPTCSRAGDRRPSTSAASSSARSRSRPSGWRPDP